MHHYISGKKLVGVASLKSTPRDRIHPQYAQVAKDLKSDRQEPRVQPNTLLPKEIEIKWPPDGILLIQRPTNKQWQTVKDLEYLTLAKRLRSNELLFNES